jgi:hypothetical protein
MMAFGFFNGDTQNASPEAIKRRREFAAKLLSTRAPRNIGEGFNAIGNNIAAAIDGARADRMEAAGNAEASRLLQPFFGSPTASAGNPVATGVATGSMATGDGRGYDRPEAREVYNAAIAAGKTPVQAAAFTAAALAESSYRTNARNPGDGRDGSDSIGLFQWNSGRASALRSFAGDKLYDRPTQVQFALNEMSGPERRAGQALRSAQTPQEATAAMLHYLRPGGYTPNNPMGAHSAAARLNNTNAILRAFGGQNTAQMPTAQGRPTVSMPTATGGQPTAPMPMASLADMPAPDAAMAQAGPDAAPQPTAPGLGVMEATNEAETQFLENRMAAEQGQAAPVEAPPVNQGDVFSPIPMGGGFNPFVQRPPFGDAPSSAPAPAAMEAALQPRMVDAPMPPQRPTDLAPQSPFVPQTMRQPMPEAPNMPQSDNDVAGAFARSGAMGNVFPMFGGQQQPQVPQMAAGGVSQGAPMNINPGQGEAQQAPQANTRSQQLAAIMASPMVPPQMKQFAMQQYQQEQAQTLARQEQARTQAQNDAAADALGIDRRLGGVAPVMAARAGQMFGNKSENIAVTNQAREAEANRLGLTGDQRNAYILNGQLPTATSSTAQISNETRAREAEAARIGLKPTDPRYQNYVLTGKMPREDAQPLSAGDKKAIMTAEDEVINFDNTIATLNRAKELNPQAYSGFGAGMMGTIGTSGLPGTGMVFDQNKAKATREFNQLMSGQAVEQMAKTLAGATTDKEMGMFVEILGNPSTPPDIRERTINRMLTLAQRQRELAMSRARDLRGGDYYKPEAQRGPAQGNAAQPGAPKTLRYNPATGALE